MTPVRIGFSPHTFGVWVAAIVVFLLFVTVLAAGDMGAGGIVVGVFFGIVLTPLWLPMVVTGRRRGIELAEGQVRILNWRGRPKKAIPAKEVSGISIEPARAAIAGGTAFLVLRGPEGQTLWRGSANLLDAEAIEPFAAALGVPLEGSPREISMGLLPPIGPRDHRLGAPGYVAFLLKLALLFLVCAAIAFLLFSGLSRLPGGFRGPASETGATVLRFLALIVAGLAILAPIKFMGTSLFDRHFRRALRGMPPVWAGGSVFVLFLGTLAAFFLGLLLS